MQVSDEFTSCKPLSKVSTQLQLIHCPHFHVSAQTSRSILYGVSNPRGLRVVACHRSLEPLPDLDERLSSLRDTAHRPTCISKMWMHLDSMARLTQPPVFASTSYADRSETQPSAPKRPLQGEFITGSLVAWMGSNSWVHPWHDRSPDSFVKLSRNIPLAVTV